MNIPSSNTVGRIAAEIPAAARVFEKYEIDYVCGGKRTLDDVCREKNLDPESLAEEIALAARMEIPTEPRDWNTASLEDVIRHILVTHHLYLENALPAMERLVVRIADLNAGQYPDLVLPLKEVFLNMKRDLLDHLREEETVQFPAIARMEKAAGATAVMAEQPLARLEHDHDEAGKALEEIRRITGNFTPPPHSSQSIRTLYQELKVFEADMLRHLHMENNILFARANRLAAAINEAIKP